jgi:hypothetical protein
VTILLYLHVFGSTLMFADLNHAISMNSSLFYLDARFPAEEGFGLTPGTH